MGAIAPTSFTAQRTLYEGGLEIQFLLTQSILAADPDLAQSREYLMSPDTQGFDIAAFQTAADKGDIKSLVQLGSLPNLSLPERFEQTPLVLRLLYALQRCAYVCDIMGREMEKLTGLLRHISTQSHNVGMLAAQVVNVALGDPIGCVCPEGVNTWHPDGRRFDLVAYDILRVNGLRRRVIMELVRNPPQVPEEVAVQWEQLLRDDHPHPTWKE